MIQSASTESAFAQLALCATIVVLMTVLCKVGCGICSSGGGQHVMQILVFLPFFDEVMTDDVTGQPVELPKTEFNGQVSFFAVLYSRNPKNETQPFALKNSRYRSLVTQCHIVRHTIWSRQADQQPQYADRHNIDYSTPSTTLLLSSLAPPIQYILDGCIWIVSFELGLPAAVSSIPIVASSQLRFTIF